MARIAVIGAGLIGRAWAIVFARAGWDVALCDSVPDQAERAKAWVKAGLAELAADGLLDVARESCSAHSGPFSIVSCAPLGWIFAK